MDRLRGLRRKLQQRVAGSGPEGFLPGSSPADPPTGESFLPAPRPAPGRKEPAPAEVVPADRDSFLPPLPGRAGGHVESGFLPGGGARPDESVPLAVAVPGEEVETEWGTLWRIVRRGSEIRPDADRLAARLPSDLGAPLAIDLETCGLRGQPLFLVGLARPAGGDLELELLLARTRAEEAAVITAAAGRLAAAESLLSFNGLDFDLPFLRARAGYFRIPLSVPERHLDLLPVCRRVYGRRYGNCRLSTLEQAVCDVARTTADVPGSQIPELYDTFSKTADGRLLQSIVYHNAMDLLTIYDLLSRTG